METHHVDAQFYEEFTSVGGGNEFEVVGRPLPPWEGFKHTKEDIFQRASNEKRKRDKEVTSTSSRPKCIKVTLPDGKVVYRL